MPAYYYAGKLSPRHQADAFLSQANPVSGTLYGVGALATALSNVSIKSAVARVTWTVQPTPLEIVIVVDGDTITHAFPNPVSATSYGIADSIAFSFAAPAAQNLIAAHTAATIPIVYEGQSVQVFARTTGGTVQLLECRVRYKRLLPI